MNIGILGGTFNPIHNGHLHIAKAALQEYSLERIDFMPAYSPPHKQTEMILDGSTRSDMISLAIEDEPNFNLNCYELETKGISYTYKTLSDLELDYPNNHYFFIIGDDSLKHFMEWMKPDIILKHCTLLVAMREETTKKELMPYVHQLQSLTSSLDLRFLQSSVIAISSSEIRTKVSQGKNIESYVPKKVATYIHQHKLYQQGVTNEK